MTAVVSAALTLLVARQFAATGALAGSAQRAAPALVTVPLRRGDLQGFVNLRANLVPVGEMPVGIPTDLNGELPVVTSVFVHQGSSVVSGEVLLAVAQRPVIVLPGRIPAFRDLVPGDSGVDVAQLQAALRGLGFSIGGDPFGTYGSGTARAVAALYARVGFSPVSTTVSDRITAGRGAPAAQAKGPTIREATVPLGEVAFVPSLPRHVVALDVRLGGMAPRIGGAIAIGSGQFGISGQVDANAKATLQPGDRGLAQSDLNGQTLRVRVRAVAATPSSQVGDGQIQGPEYVVALVPTGTVPADLVGQNLHVRIRTGRSGAASWIVPAAAVTTTASGATFITVVIRRRQHQVSVTTGLVSGGSVAVRSPRGDLSPGEPVVIGVGVP